MQVLTLWDRVPPDASPCSPGCINCDWSMLGSAEERAVYYFPGYQGNFPKVPLLQQCLTSPSPCPVPQMLTQTRDPLHNTGWLN